MNARIQRLLGRSEQAVAVVAPVNYNGVNFTRALRAEGVQSIGVFDTSSQCYNYTNSCEKVFCKDVNGEALIDTLQEIGRAAKTKPVLIPIGDLQVLLFSKHYALLQEYFLFNIPPAESIAVLIDKTKLYQWGQGRFPFPKTYTIETAEDLHTALESIKFPVVFKPRYRSDAWLKTTLPKASLFHDAPSVQTFYHQASEVEKVFLLSEYIEGPDSNIWLTHFYYANGEPLAYYTDRKLRQWPHLLGTGAYCISERNDEIITLTKAMLSECGYSGMGAMEFKKDLRTGEYMVIEPCCGRPSHHFYIGRGEGVNLPFLVYCHLTGKPLPESEQSGKIFGFLDEERDFRSALIYLWQKELSIREYLRDILRVRLCVNWSLTDPLVGVIFLIGLVRTLGVGIIRRVIQAVLSKRRLRK